MIHLRTIACLTGLLTLSLPAFSQDVTTVEATDSDISENLDLEAVASLFGEAEDLEDFEEKLNDPKTQISNLDLNEDGEVDYLRVVEASESETHVVFVQAVIGEDEYQDVATIDVEKDDSGETQVQVVGDVHMYRLHHYPGICCSTRDFRLVLGTFVQSMALSISLGILSALLQTLGSLPSACIPF